MIGTIVANHRIEAQVGQTPVAAIYRARHPLLGRDAAALVFGGGNAKCNARVLAAASLASRIHHPNFVEVYEAGTLADGRPFVIREWIDGHLLADELRQRAVFAPADALEIVEEIAAALGAVHAAGEAHGNLHDGSVFLVPASGFSLTKVVDFGAGRPHRRSAYVAPEVAAGAIGDARADIYSLGVLVHHLLTGAPAPRRAISPSIDRVLDRCLQPEPRARFADLSVCLARLRQALVPSAKPVARIVDAVGVRIELRLCSDDAAALGALGDVLALARATCVHFDFDIAREQPNALLAVRPRGDGGDTADLLPAMLSLHRELLDEAQSQVGVTLVVHRGPIIRRQRGDSVDYVGGELLSSVSWPAAPVDGVLATRALTPLPAGVKGEPVPGAPELVRLSAAS